MPSNFLCTRCGKLSIPRPHSCPPKFIVWCPDYGIHEDDAYVVYAASFNAAAKEFVENLDGEEAPSRHDFKEPVEVVLRRGDEQKTKTVTREPSITYWVS